MTDNAHNGILRRIFPSWGRRCAHYAASRHGNVAILAALFIPVIVLAMGGALDYISAARREDTLNGIADAAALAGVTPAMMQDSCYPDQTASTCAPVVTAVEDVFNAQKGGVPGVRTATPNVLITDTASPINRTVTVSYSGTSNNLFSGIIHVDTFNLSGHAVAKNALAPQTIFYMLVDTSPSMAFPATADGVSAMIRDTPNAGSCAIGCHESDATADTDEPLYNPSNVTCSAGSSVLSNGYTDGSVQFPRVYTTTTTKKNGKTTTTTTDSTAPDKQTVGADTNTYYYGAEDAYALSRCLAIPLRIDYVNTAVSGLMTTAPAMALQNNTIYEVDLYTLDSNSATTAAGMVALNALYTWNPNLSTDADTNMTANFTAAQAAAGTLAQLEVYKNNCLTSSDCSVGDADSSIDIAGLEGMYNIMPVAGNGGTAMGETPEQVLFIITDGVNDYMNGSTRTINAVNSASNSAGDWCTQIKTTKNTRIAFLYLTYNPLGSNSYYVDNVEPFQPSIGTAASNCASPGLYTEVDNDSEINSALEALFQKAVQTAYLSQ